MAYMNKSYESNAGRRRLSKPALAAAGATVIVPARTSEKAPTPFTSILRATRWTL